MEYIIGLIDELEDERRKIRRSIKTNLPANTNVIFIDYEIEGESNSLISRLESRALSDIENGKINGLIIDYRIERKEDRVIHGSELFVRLRRIVPQFPIVMLTDHEVGCGNEDEVDMDKIYRKKGFYQLESDYSQEKISSIFKNMEKYLKKRMRLEAELMAAKDRYERNKGTIDDVIVYEKELSYFVPSTISDVEKALDTSQIKETLQLLQQTKELLGE